jgi:DNA replicative helicase MCM subunit Mcm2 (Cdc46/Mcm family)
MAQHTSSIDKAGINTSIPINTNILACANPKKSQFDLLKSVFPQTQVIDPTTYSRFSLIYAIPDKSDKERDMEIARYINHKGYNEQALSDELIIKVIAYLKKNFNPVIVENSPADDKLIKFFADVRAIAEAQGNGKRITARDNDNIKNLAIAIARLNCEQVVSKQDVERAIDVYKKAMYTLELDLNTVGAISNVKSQNEQELDREAEDITIEFLEENGARPGKYLVEDLYKHLQASCNYSREQAKELFNELKSNY